jgi:hypothetical protein
MQFYQGKEFHAIKTFTYFIPTPPNRKNGYREKEFDKILYELLQKDFELLEFKTESASNGMWIICLIGAKSKEAAILNLDVHQDIGLEDRNNSDDIIFEDNL